MTDSKRALEILPDLQELNQSFCLDYFKSTKILLTHKQNVLEVLAPKLQIFFSSIIEVVQRKYPEIVNLRILLNIDKRVKDICIKYLRNLEFSKIHEGNIKTYLKPILEAQLTSLILELEKIINTCREKKELDEKKKNPDVTGGYVGYE